MTVCVLVNTLVSTYMSYNDSLFTCEHTSFYLHVLIMIVCLLVNTLVSTYMSYNDSLFTSEHASFYLHVLH
jgi:hypothetical protein